MDHLLRSLDGADKIITLTLNFNGGSIADSFFYALSSSFSWIPLAFLFLYLLYKKTGSNWKAIFFVVCGLALTVTLCDQISSSIIKPLVMRPRPSHCPAICWLLHFVNNYHGGRYGFVSSHAANSFGAVVYTTLLIRRWKFTVISFVFAISVSCSRIYLGVHYFGDIICGWILGTIIGLTMYGVVKRIPYVIFIKKAAVQKKTAA